MAGSGRKIRGAVLASGSGSNAENIIRFCREHAGKIEIAVVICDRTEAGVIGRAERLGVPCSVIPVVRGVGDAQEKKVLDVLSSYAVDWVFLAGYMRIISADFLSRFADPILKVNRVVNIHPSLLPAFPGKDSYRRTYDAGVKESGVTLHFVDAGVDTGPVIAQKKFSRVPGESFEDFRARGLALEYEVYREFLEQLSRGRINALGHQNRAGIRNH
ncbi:MAG: phosphoribosylglycinamide formyltransferase [Pseudomonadota bacterium]